MSEKKDYSIHAEKGREDAHKGINEPVKIDNVSTSGSIANVVITIFAPFLDHVTIPMDADEKTVYDGARKDELNRISNGGA